MSFKECPLTNHMYGGMPEVGGYSANTEFEIGAQRIAEAAHCILGSLHKIVRYNHDFSLECAHIYEELGIIEKSMKEYGRSLYADRMTPSKLRKMWGECDNEIAYVEKSAASIRENSPKLAALARSASDSLDIHGLDEDVVVMAKACYDVIAALADAMRKSVALYPDFVDDPYGDPVLRQASVRLREVVDEKYSPAMTM